MIYMPSTMTHSYFAFDVYDKMDNKSKISSLDNFKLYSQGTDPFMFYNYLIGKKNKYYCKVQHTVHTAKTREFFINIINYIIDNNLCENKDLYTFLCGNICHYYLDLYVHPFIYYKTGKYSKKDKRTYKYNALHQDMEYSIDRYLIMKRSNEKVYKFKIYKEIFDKYNISNDVMKCLDYVLSKTYGMNNMGIAYKKSVKMMKRFFYLFNYDRFGLKKKIYNLVDIVTPDSFINIKELSYYVKDINLDYLNMDRKKWNHPSIRNEIYNYSFDDLYNLSLHDTLEAINVVTECLDKKKMDINKINNTFKDLSYVTGKDCKLKLKIKYFEF